MAVLNTLRTKFGLAVSIIVALGLLSFIIDPSQIISTVQENSSKYDVGNIAGKKVSYADFQSDIERYTTLNEMLSGSSVRSEQEQQQIRNQAWEELVNLYLFFPNAAKAGINVGEAEMKALLSGEGAAPEISQNPMFQDENGNFSPAAVVDFYNNIASDASGRTKLYWDNLENVIKTRQFYTKYGSLFMNSNFQNALMQRKAIEENNQTAEVEFVMVPFGYAQDSTVVVSDSEIKAFYNGHKNFFKQQANRDIEYVVFEVVPSEEDIEAANEKMVAAYEEFATVENMKNFLAKNSERPLSNYWYKAGELATVNSEISEFVDANPVGAVSPIVKAGNNFYAAKVLGAAPIADDMQVRVILAADAKEVTDSLVAQLRLSEPMQMTQTYIIPGCEVLFSAPLNTPQLIKSAQYGQLLAEVVSKGEAVAKKQVAILEVAASSSNQTFNRKYAEANEFQVLAKNHNYKYAVDSTHVYSHPMSRVLESTANYGSVENAKEVTRWIFDAKKNDVSDIISINQKYFVIATVKDIHKEGVAKIEEVSPMIKQQLYGEKYGVKKAAEIKDQIAGLTDMAAIAEKLGSSVSTQSVAFSSMGAQSLDPAFIGAVAAAKEGVVSAPVAGTIGVYVFKVNSRDAGSFYTEDDAANYMNQLNQYASQMILPVMMEAADVKDNRARFY